MNDDPRRMIIESNPINNSNTQANNKERTSTKKQIIMSHLLCSQDTRTHVVGELYDTERSYVESLQILVEKYMRPLKGLESNRVLVDSVLVDEIFYSIPDILQHHENFLSALQERLSSDWDSSQVIGNVFIEAFTNQQIIDDYTAFINNWKNARQAIKVATQAKPAFERFLEAMSREHRNKLTLDALLIMPVQRIPRYELLIKELIKHTPQDHPDHKPLMEAQKKIHELALKIDRAEKEMIHQEQLRDLETLIEGHVELQHHQRAFIRYDLVTIVSASALAATKKERVLFLFCDLLIMTSIKKKASRRSNLQNAFANSSNDLSLLEGNKFKLLLRVPLDQIEIRLDYDQMQLHQQHQEEQQTLHLQQENKLIQERRREIETDLATLQQMELLACQLSNGRSRGKFDELLGEMIANMRQILASIELNDMQMLTDEQHSTLSQYSGQDLFLTPSPASISSTSFQQQQLTSVHSSNHLQVNLQSVNQCSSSPILPTSHHHQQDSSTSLEFLINNNAAGKESSDAAALNSNDQGHSIVGPTAADNLQQSSNCDSLVVTFASIERRQAFIQAFMEAKQHRYQQKQQQQQAKIFSSSITLKLAPPGGHEKRSSAPADPRLHHQESADAYLSGSQRPSSLSASMSSRISVSSPLQQQQPPCAGPAIVHQMSAPQSLALAAASVVGFAQDESGCPTREWPQCTSCSYNLVAEAEKAQLRQQHHHHHHHHHHHQLMHQPASQPASLDTFCCHDKHGNWNEEQRKRHSNDILANDQERADYYYNHQHMNMSRQMGLNSVVNLNNCTTDAGLSNDEDQQQQQPQRGQKQLIDQMNFNLLLSKCAPKFLVTLPVDFLTTQHPALQFTCSALGRSNSPLAAIESSLPVVGKSQTVADNLGQLWLCMSNGYVSHVALVTIRRRELRRPANDGQAESCGNSAKSCYSITPVVISAGDICKSHINCATQVKWTKSLQRQRQRQRQHSGESPQRPSQTVVAGAQDAVADDNDDDNDNADATQPKELATTSDQCTSPPIDIKQCPKTRVDPQERLSESAPSPLGSSSSTKHASNPDVSRNPSSASTTRLEVPLPSRSTHHDQHNTRSRPGSERKRSIHNEICHRHYYHEAGIFAKQHSNHHRTSAAAVGVGAGAGACAASWSLQQIPRAHCSKSHLNHHHSHPHSHHYAHHHHPHHNHPHHHHHTRSHAQQQQSHNSSNSRHGLGHNHSHQHHHHHHQHHHSQHTHHSEQHLQQKQPHSEQIYGSRHNTVNVAELRRSLDRQETIAAGEPRRRLGLGQSLSPQPSSHRLASSSAHRSQSPVQNKCEKKNNSLDLADERQRSISPTPKTARPTTPTSLATASMKGFRSARLMRNQASLKTSSILAKLVGGATRRSAYMRRSNAAHSKSSDLDLDDNDTDTDTNHQQQQQQQQQNDDTQATAEGYSAKANDWQPLDPATMMNNNAAIISPLSSVSSLNSTTSSFTVNSVCASSPNRSSCELLAHSYSTTCCISGAGAGVTSSPTPELNTGGGGYLAGGAVRGEVCGHRGRSATAPSRQLCGQMMIGNLLNPTNNDNLCSLTHHRSFAIGDRADSTAKLNSSAATTTTGRAYKVSDLLNDDSPDQEQQKSSVETSTIKRSSSGSGARQSAPCQSRAMNSSLWLGCDDGSLIIIDCMMADDEPCANNSSSHEAREQKTFTCGNVHSEIKLSSPICDISTYKDEMVFVALSNGQLAVFSRANNSTTDEEEDDVVEVEDDCNKDQFDVWSLTKPEIITITENELNSTARLCLIDVQYLWYSYGRHIFVLNIGNSLKLETTIMAPTNDLSLRLTVQAITIDNMELMQNLHGVWVSFRNSHLIQFYDTRSHKLLLEINLFEPTNRLLSYGNEIIRQHKTACLKATSLLHYYNKREQCNTLFVGTSAGIILYLNISAEQMISREPQVLDWKPQIASLRHGHSGHVKLLRLIEMDNEHSTQTEQQQEDHHHHHHQEPQADDDSNSNSNNNNNNGDSSLYLISGGTGLDIYGPSGEQQNFISQLNSDEDSLNHLMIWQL